MRAGIGAVQHTLTVEASSVLKRAIADAQRRGHAQVTPLHVASSLLSVPSSMLQQACIQSHRHVPHPLQCRALDLCFNVALERLPTAIHQTSGSTSQAAQEIQSSPPNAMTLSNALVAALKRAQAHQRRGSPEQQQVPLLTVKVEMEQLVISILDDPSVSRVMREAGFSSTRAKTSLEHSQMSSLSTRTFPFSTSGGVKEHHNTGNNNNNNGNSMSVVQNRTAVVTLNDHHSAIGVMKRSRAQRNPVLIGDESSTKSVLKDLVAGLRVVEQFKGVKVLEVEKGFGVCKRVTERWVCEMAESGVQGVPVLVVLGSLGWCCDDQQQRQSPGVAGAVLGELAKVLVRGERRRFWFVAQATSHCYMRFLAQFPDMESRLGFQPLPVSISSMRPRFSPATDSHPFLRFKMPFRLLEDDELGGCCTDCTMKFEQESLVLQQQQVTESAQSSSGDSLPLWMKSRSGSPQAVTKHQSQEFVRELKRKWITNCQTLHSLKSCAVATLPNLIDSNSSSSQTSSPEGGKSIKAFNASSWLSLSTITEAEAGAPNLSLELSLENSTSCCTGLLRSPEQSKKLTTELLLGTPGSPDDSIRFHRQRLELGSVCTRSSETGSCFAPRRNFPDVTYKSIFKQLCEKVPWQVEAAGKVASAVVSCGSGEKRRGSSVKKDVWIMFTGPDRMGKRKVANALAEVVYGSTDSFVKVSLNSQGAARRKLWQAETQQQDRGRTVVDKVADAVKSKPFSVVLLEDYDQADVSVRRSLVKSMERGKIQHSSGKDVGLGNSIFILTVNSAEKNQVEEKLGCVEELEVEIQVRQRKEDAEGLGREILVVDEGNVLIREKVECVGEKRKAGSSSVWGEKIQGLLASSKKKKKVVALDLNLGLGSWETCVDEGGAFDEVVEFEEFCVEGIATKVMERIEKLACNYGVCVEIEARVLDTMVATVWEEAEGFEKWFKETIEDTVASSDRGPNAVVRICC